MFVALIAMLFLSVPGAPTMRAGQALDAVPGNRLAWDAAAGTVEWYEIAWNGSAWASLGLSLEAPVPSAPGGYAVAVRACNTAGCGPALTATITVTTTQPPPPPPNVVQVSPGGDLQAALTACQPGGVVELQAGGVYTGTFTLTAVAAPGCTLRSSATLPTRPIDPIDAPLLPVLRSGSIFAAVEGVWATNWTLDGLRFEGTTTGEGEILVLQDAVNIRMDRLLIVPGSLGQKRAIRGNGQAITLTRSHIANIWREGQDSQAFCAWDGAGPYTITDNYLEAASENVMFGGSDSKSVERIPADILIDHNVFSKPLSWKGQPKNVKNLLELKQAKRVIIRNNLFERSWVDGQGGAGILFSVHNDDDGSPWAVVEDVLFEKNVVRDVITGIGVVGRDSYHVSGQGTRITIRDNDITASNEFMRIADDVGVLVVTNNRVQNGGYAALLWGATYAVRDLTWTNNTLSNPQIAGDGVSFADAIPRYVEKFNGVLTTPIPPPPPPPPPVDPCVVEPITLTVTAWPTKNRKTRADFSVFSPRGPASVTFTFAGQQSTSATATDGTCSVTVTR
jgi:hypothetical protein